MGLIKMWQAHRAARAAEVRVAAKVPPTRINRQGVQEFFAGDVPRRTVLDPKSTLGVFTFRRTGSAKVLRDDQLVQLAMTQALEKMPNVKWSLQPSPSGPDAPTAEVSLKAATLRAQFVPGDKAGGKVQVALHLIQGGLSDAQLRLAMQQSVEATKTVYPTFVAHIERLRQENSHVGRSVDLSDAHGKMILTERGLTSPNHFFFDHLVSSLTEPKRWSPP